MTSNATRWMTFLPTGQEIAVPLRPAETTVTTPPTTETGDHTDPIFDLATPMAAISTTDSLMTPAEPLDLISPLDEAASQSNLLAVSRPWPIWLAAIATTGWLAVVIVHILLHYRGGLSVDFDRAMSWLSAGFSPMVAFWLIALVLTRRQSLVADQQHLHHLLTTALAPLRQAEQDAGAIGKQASSHASRIEQASEKLGALLEQLHMPFDAQIQRLEEVSHRLDTTRALAAESAQQLRATLGELGKMAQDVAGEVPLVVATMDQARMAGVQHCADVGHATHQLITTLQAAAGQAQDLEPLVRSATAKAETAAIILHERLQDLRTQSEATSTDLDASTAKVADILDQSRQWTTDHMVAIEAAITHLDGLGSNRLRGLAADLSKLGESGNILLATMIDSLSTKLNSLDGDVRDRLGRLRADWQTLLTAADQTGTDVGMKLLETMGRVRAVADDVAKVAADSASHIVTSTEQTLLRTQASADSVTRATLSAFESHAEKLSALAEAANMHAMAMKAVLAKESNESLVKLSATIIESLNAYAIDIAKLFATEITDDDWRAYMNGDRGLFVRRFIKLAPKGIETKVALRIKADSEFREAVQRFVRGFESLLKQTMGDGGHDALSITLLASDLGKLYVILARATERL